MNVFPKLPNVSTFKIRSLSKYHPPPPAVILKWFGIYKRMKPATFIDTPNRNNRMNNYIRRIEKYLNNSVGEPKFWNLGWIILTRSTSFRMSQLRQTFPTWYKSMTIEELDKLIHEYNNLDLKNFEFIRKNIPKPGTDILRPLGIPTPA